MPFVFPITQIYPRALSCPKRSSYLLVFSVMTALFYPVASTAALQQEFEFGDSADYVRSLPDAFDCSALYQADVAEESEQEGVAFCFDEANLFHTEGGMLTAFMADGAVGKVAYTLEMSPSNYSAVLSGLRRLNYVFTQVTVGNETLDVLSGLKLLDRQTLDDQLFTLANHADFSVPREFILLDHRSFKRALKAGIKSVDSLLNDKTAQRGFERLTMVHIRVSSDEILLQASQPFAG
ncbi:hypothetical protein [Photobacterium lutimaris]|uniref:Uncharacterized protein n=1 Tax=Photobacterium lutimaris TaxID=388278 RepID=A0A2T3J2W5_9GAMM|nr:hypothetical protein [Photobacterium lutimaris]PSU35638.1 hypothetical protein C9I99_01040 [Photobacterium lutimaris]TDR78691.1 hypothetical protein DFP78_101204 [Photobacterium lutimaris]